MKINPQLRIWSFAKCLGMLAGMVCLAGCAVGPDYHRPQPLPATNSLPAKLGDFSITNQYGAWKMAAPAAHLSRGTWWDIYNDAELNRLEGVAATNNQQIVQALANFDQSRAAVGVAQANFFPQVTADPSYTRQHTSAHSSPLSSLSTNSQSLTYNTFSVGGDATWEIDLFGRVRRLTESARAQSVASADDLESMKLAIQAEVASDYFSLRALDDQSAFLNRTADDYLKALQLTQDRHKAGIADEQDVAEAETQWRAARAQIPATDLQRAQMRHALAVLCGQPATTFALTAGTLGSTNVPVVPPAVPSEWLEHRPDVAAAERSMAAANANIGVAKAAFFPRVMLNGSGGYLSISASSLFNWPSHVWAIGPTVDLPLFTGGANLSQYRSAKAAYQGTVAAYRQSVLGAFQDVEDELAAQTLLANQLEEQSLALNAARHSLDLARQRYKAGVEEYLDVITTETTEMTQELTVIQLRGQNLTASVALVKALGAGWSAK